MRLREKKEEESEWLGFLTRLIEGNTFKLKKMQLSNNVMHEAGSMWTVGITELPGTVAVLGQ